MRCGLYGATGRQKVIYNLYNIDYLININCFLQQILLWLICIILFQDEITTSGYAAAQYIKNELKFSGKLYVLGSPALSQELTEAGIENIGAGVRNVLSLSAIL